MFNFNVLNFRHHAHCLFECSQQPFNLKSVQPARSAYRPLTTATPLTSLSPPCLRWQTPLGSSRWQKLKRPQNSNKSNKTGFCMWGIVGMHHAGYEHHSRTCIWFNGIWGTLVHSVFQRNFPNSSCTVLQGKPCSNSLKSHHRVLSEKPDITCPSDVPDSERRREVVHHEEVPGHPKLKKSSGDKKLTFTIKSKSIPVTPKTVAASTGSAREKWLTSIYKEIENFLQNIAKTDADPSSSSSSQWGKMAFAVPDGLCSQTARSDSTD